MEFCDLSWTSGMSKGLLIASYSTWWHLLHYTFRRSYGLVQNSQLTGLLLLCLSIQLICLWQQECLVSLLPSGIHKMFLFCSCSSKEIWSLFTLTSVIGWYREGQLIKWPRLNSSFLYLTGSQGQPQQICSYSYLMDRVHRDNFQFRGLSFPGKVLYCWTLHSQASASSINLVKSVSSYLVIWPSELF